MTVLWVAEGDLLCLHPIRWMDRRDAHGADYTTSTESEASKCYALVGVRQIGGIACSEQTTEARSQRYSPVQTGPPRPTPLRYGDLLWSPTGEAGRAAGTTGCDVPRASCQNCCGYVSLSAPAGEGERILHVQIRGTRFHDRLDARPDEEATQALGLVHQCLVFDVFPHE
jgi:hypothetical protein